MKRRRKKKGAQPRKNIYPGCIVAQRYRAESKAECARYSPIGDGVVYFDVAASCRHSPLHLAGKPTPVVEFVTSVVERVAARRLRQRRGPPRRRRRL